MFTRTALFFNRDWIQGRSPQFLRSKNEPWFNTKVLRQQKLLGEALRSKEPSEASAETSTTVRASSIPIGQKDASKEAFFCIPIWDENAMGSTTKVAKQTFCGKLCEAKSRAKREPRRAPLCERVQSLSVNQKNASKEAFFV